MTYLNSLRKTKKLLILTGCLLSIQFARGQDVYYADVQDMKVWFNPALKTDKISILHANLRSVKYQGITAYTSKGATIELPLSSHDKSEDNIGYADLAIGINADDATNGVMKVSTAMMAFSYALPLNYDNTYLAAGLQAAYTFSQVSSIGSYLFPDHFDQYGALGSAVSADPYLSGYEYDYFTAGAGVTLFHSGSTRQWYFGGSIRHLNQPYTEWTHTFRLDMNKGIQAGYSEAITNEDLLGGYAYLNWEGPVNEQIFGVQYTRKLDDSSRYEFSAGLGYRFGDALIPNVGLKFGDGRIAFFYEFNFSGNTEGYNNRTAFEFAFSLIL
jgi:Type IX secretion system membrane protein PorP/SprF